jgi:hypothetical protein
MQQRDAVRAARPELTLMTEHMVDVPVWHGINSERVGNATAEELMALGVSRPLIERLRAWERGWDQEPFTSSSPQTFRPGSPLEVRLARQLQAELPDYRILLWTPEGPRPVEEWTG